MFCLFKIEGELKMRKQIAASKILNKVVVRFSNKFFEGAIFAITALVVIIAAMYLVTGFYENSYPYNTIAQLPRNYTTFLLNIFNGYTEKVPPTANLSTIMNQIDKIRQSATDNVNNAVEVLVLAFVLAIFYPLVKENSRISLSKTKSPSGLITVFLFSLLASQYFVSLIFYLKGYSESGVSLFVADSTAVAICFSIFYLIKIIGRIKEISPNKITKELFESIILISILIAILILILVATTESLFTNLGLISYNSDFKGIYFVHFYGLFVFIMVFGLAFYFKKILNTIKNTREKFAQKQF